MGDERSRDHLQLGEVDLRHGVPQRVGDPLFGVVFPLFQDLSGEGTRCSWGAEGSRQK